jgi:hypothetical protein
MSSDNPYRAPQEVGSPARRSSWVGWTVTGLALLVYGPMTITPLARVFIGKSDERPIMLAAFTFNGLVLAGLLWLGRWLRRRAAKGR